MTNEMIIFWESVELMNAGKIGTTGRILTMELPDGNVTEIPEPEPIHTFACWKGMGYSVKKGEHAIARFMIWKGAEKAVKDENGNDTDEKALKLFRKEACFFTAGQVEPSAERKPRRSTVRAAASPAPAAEPAIVPVASSGAGYGSWLS